MEPITAKSDVQLSYVTVGRFIVHNGRFVARVRGGEANGGGGPAAATADAGGEGQGEGLGLYDLTEVPEHLRAAVEPIAKKIGTNASVKIEEQAAALKEWEPFSSIEGLREVPGEELAELIQFRNDVLQDPDAMKAWWADLGKEAGWLNADGTPLEGGEGGEGDETDPAVAELREAVGELTGVVRELAEWKNGNETEKSQNAAKEAINADLAKLAEEHNEGEAFDDETRSAILRFALSYPQDPEAVRKGYADLQKLLGRSQSELVTNKLGQPTPPAGGGRADATPPEITTFAQAREAARARRATPVGS